MYDVGYFVCVCCYVVISSIRQSKEVGGGILKRLEFSNALLSVLVGLGWKSDGTYGLFDEMVCVKVFFPLFFLCLLG